MNRTVIFQAYWNTLAVEWRVKVKRCFWDKWAWIGAGPGSGEPGAEWLLNARSAEGKVLLLHSAYILWCEHSSWLPGSSVWVSCVLVFWSIMGQTWQCVLYRSHCVKLRRVKWTYEIEFLELLTQPMFSMLSSCFFENLRGKGWYLAPFGVIIYRLQTIVTPERFSHCIKLRSISFTA